MIKGNVDVMDILNYVVVKKQLKLVIDVKSLFSVTANDFTE